MIYELYNFIFTGHTLVYIIDIIIKSKREAYNYVLNNIISLYIYIYIILYLFNWRISNMAPVYFNFDCRG